MVDITLQELRILGGKAVLKKYGRQHFRDLNKKSQEAKRKKKANLLHAQTDT